MNWDTMSKWEKVRFGSIAGIVDSYGCVHSRLSEHLEFHEEVFPPSHCKWRWSSDKSIWWITSNNKPTSDQQDAIRRHLSRKYGLKWWENGHHDIDHLAKMWRNVPQESSTD